MKAKTSNDLVLVTRAEQQVAETLGYTVRDLHQIWKRGRSGHVDSDQVIRQILNNNPRAWILMNVFIRHSKGGDGTKNIKNKKSFLRTKKSASSKKTESIWTSAKSKWISVSSGGLPSLGKRR